MLLVSVSVLEKLNLMMAHFKKEKIIVHVILLNYLLIKREFCVRSGTLKGRTLVTTSEILPRKKDKKRSG